MKLLGSLAACLLLIGQSGVSAPPATVWAVVATDGRPVPSFRADQFRASVDGHPVRVLNTAREISGLVVAVVLDRSASVTWQLPRSAYMPFSVIGRDPAAILPGLERGMIPHLRVGDRVSVGVFESRVLRRTPFIEPEASAAILAAAKGLLSINTVDQFGPSAIWDMTAEAVKAVGHEPGHRAVLLVSDGEASGDWIGLGDLIALAIKANVSVSTLFLPFQETNANIQGHDSPEPMIRRLSAETGGVFRANQSLKPGWSSPLPPFAEILDLLHGSYELNLDVAGFGPGHHLVEVSVSAANTTVIAPKTIEIPAK